MLVAVLYGIAAPTSGAVWMALIALVLCAGTALIECNRRADRREPYAWWYGLLYIFAWFAAVTLWRWAVTKGGG